MKTITRLLLGIIGAALVSHAPLLRAGLPQPMCVYYGQACDGYGLPYRTNAEVVLKHGTNEIARQTIAGSLSPGVNFALYVHLDDGRTTTPYSSRALHSGDVVSIVVRDADGLKTIMENQTVPPVAQPGELVLINATAAEDSDNDGLPDQWEWELIAWSGGRLHTLADVRPDDDFDGDGMTNLQEYRAGTFAFLDYDFLYLEQYAVTPAHNLCLSFLTVPGKAYRVLGASQLNLPVWEACSFSLYDTGALQSTAVEGNGDWLSLFVPMDTTTRYFRLEAH